MDKIRILLVEDDADINELIAYNLRKEGYLVEQAFDGIEAKRRLIEEFFPIVLLDIMLPGIDGFNLCDFVKKDERLKKSYVIIISAKTAEKDKLYAHILGADCYLEKPFFVKELLKVIKELDSFLEKEYTVRV